MAARLIDGRHRSAILRAALKQRVAGMPHPPGLAMIMVGAHPASAIYVQAKEKACAEVGIKSYVYHLPEKTTAAELNTTIDALNDNPLVHGILLQMPLPDHLKAGAFLARIHPHKDVDGLHPVNLGMLLSGTPTIIPCTPRGIMHLIEQEKSTLHGQIAVVVGKSALVGKPIAQLLLMAGCTVLHAHSQTHDLASITRQADILITATGVAGLITGHHIKPGAVVIDVGITRHQNRLTGDVDMNTASPIAGAITPVPGGVGPMTIAYLLENTVTAAQNAER